MTGVVKGGITLFRGPGLAARRYLESDRATADEYYLEAGTALAEFTITDARGEAVDARTLNADEYAGWVDWVDPTTGISMGTPREAGDGKKGSPRFAEMVINAPKSLSIAAALHPDISTMLDAAQADAAGEIRRWLAQHSTTRVGPRGAQEVVPVESLQTVTVTHKTSRAGDPHRHVHFQIGTRVQAAGKWRALDTGALFKQQGAIRALGTAVIAAHPQLAAVLDAHGLTLDPVSGEVLELQPFNAMMSKRSRQVERNLDRLERDWEQQHPGETAGPAVRARLLHKAWAHERPSKKPSVLATEAGWRAELEDAGYTPDTLTKTPQRRTVGLDDLSIQDVASRALDRCAAGASAWTPHTIREHVTRITTEHGITASPAEVREFVYLATDLARSDCFSILPEGVARPDHVAHLTSLRVMEAETRLRDLLTAATPLQEVQHPDVAALDSAQRLDSDQLQAAAAVSSTDPLVIIEGAAGSGKTTMLRPAIAAAKADGRKTRVVAPTKKAAHVAGQTLGIPSGSVAALVYAHGFRWNSDGVWTRLAPGGTDPDTGHTYSGPPEDARLSRGERVVVDEAGMLDQDTATALLTITAEAGATVALVGDRAQLAAVGRGGVLDIAAKLRGTTYDMTGLHRFTRTGYASLTLQLRDGTDPATAFDQLQAMGLVHLHDSDDAMHERIAATAAPGDAVTVATNEDARELNARIQAGRLERGDLDHTRTITGSDGLDIGVGEVIQTRKNDSTIGVANRQTFTVQHVAEDGTVYAVENGNDRKHQQTITLPPEYVEAHTHLAYASTAYGVQGVTVTDSHTVLDEAVSAAGLYVGLTRGTHDNTLHIIAETEAEAREQFVQAMTRDCADRGLDHATAEAHDATRGLITDGPVAFVNAERQRLTAAIAHAETQAERWIQAEMAITKLRQTHAAEREEHTTVATAAEQYAQQIREEVTAPLVAEALTDGQTVLTAQQEAWDAGRAYQQAGRLRRRTAARTRDDANQAHDLLQTNVQQRWGTVPHTPEGLDVWAHTVAEQQTEQHPAVVAAEREANDARAAGGQLARKQLAESQNLRARIYGKTGRAPEGGPAGRATRWRDQAKELRNVLREIEMLPTADAAQLIRQRHEEIEARRVEAERARAERAKQITPMEHERRPQADPHRERGIGF
ncbi:AAA family ATPase [Microbacterium resistens]|uniref:MobF family relaxase n=1 Tax=Microbacterium resistens TaxID=156977 RepID=UPI001C585AF7|nr:MobF family relaxase [Microbacterium resistens]MBW1639024.1 AAA family ATPase [Microbacterium resistens]